MKNLSTVGRIIMIDGPDGVGKTTQLALLAEHLRQRGYNVYSNRINGGTAMGEALRQVYLDPHLPRPPETDLYIILAMHAALASELLQRRQAGEICLVDRSPLSILAYQVYGSGLDKEVGLAATRNSLKLFDADLIICYEAPLDVLRAHREQRHKSTNNNYFENQLPDYVERVIAGYQEATRLFDGLQTVDTSRSIPDVQTATLKLIEPILPAHDSSVV
jgi:dTMP kinase